MALRCLLFSTHEEIVQPILQVLTDLGIEGEHCQSAVDAVEQVTTQLFQIVITDWDDQPEAAFLLKTARDLKAAARPLTLAIVTENARPEALHAGANSVLLKPVRPEQARDTLSTACQLLRSKQQSPVQAAAPSHSAHETQTRQAKAGTSAAAAPALASIVQAPEKLRVGEFLQTSSSAPGAQFDTEPESDVQKSLDSAAMAEMDALTELEPMASAVQAAPAEQPTCRTAGPAHVPEPPQEALTGWAALQSRLTKTTPASLVDAATTNDLSNGETASSVSQAAPKTETVTPSQPQAESEAALFAYVSGESQSDSEPEQARPKRGRFVFALALAIASCIAVGVPRFRHRLPLLYRNTVHAGRSLLNPPPAALPQAVAQHDSFGQSGDEYKLPVPTNIPDATTDPSQIQVLPVVDPTAKPDKNASAAAAAAQAATTENPNIQDPNQPAPSVQVEEKSQAATAAPDATSNPAPAVEIASPAQILVPANPAPSGVTPPVAVPIHVATPAPTHVTQPSVTAGIPSSLKSQLASSTPEASGAKPPESAMSSIEPVNLPEAAVRDLLAQPVDPAYPARAGGQRGSVVLQVLIGRDGAVQDAKFLQGSLVFARSAIDAVKQWKFRPYLMNGRPVAVQSLMTLNFKPPA
jgi:protein TonB